VSESRPKVPPEKRRTQKTRKHGGQGCGEGCGSILIPNVYALNRTGTNQAQIYAYDFLTIQKWLKIEIIKLIGEKKNEEVSINLT
jgi:hypothetical protein